MRFRFGQCTLDTSSRELLRSDAPVHLTGKAFRLLEVLIEHRPKALSKDDLQELVWPGVFVSEVNLTSLVTELRKAIGDEARDPTFLRTVYGFGYAFSGEVEEEAAAGSRAATNAAVSRRYRLLWGRKEIALREGENILGRGPESIEWIDRDTVSRRHARIVVAGGRATIEDLASKNGTYLRGERLDGPAAIADGDGIKLGSVPLTFRVFADDASTATGFKARRRPS
jgi:DNA-binding winged helix-turn-helix (wHTH) protein